MSDSKQETKDSKEETVKPGIPRTPEYEQDESETLLVTDAMQKVKNWQTENVVSLILNSSCHREANDRLKNIG